MDLREQIHTDKSNTGNSVNTFFNEEIDAAGQNVIVSLYPNFTLYRTNLDYSAVINDEDKLSFGTISSVGSDVSDPLLLVGSTVCIPEKFLGSETTPISWTTEPNVIAIVNDQRELIPTADFVVAKLKVEEPIADEFGLITNRPSIKTYNVIACGSNIDTIALNDSILFNPNSPFVFVTKDNVDELVYIIHNTALIGKE